MSLPRLMMTYMCEATSKANASLPYRMVITLILRKFRVPISEEEPKKLLRHTDIYNVPTLHKMRFKKINGYWKRQRGESRITKEGPNRPMEEDIPKMPTTPTSDQPASSIPTRLSEEVLRQIAGYLTDELTTRGHMLVDHPSMTLIRVELDRLSKRLISLEDT